MQRRLLLQSAAAVLAAPIVLRIPRAQAQEVTLRLHHFLPAVSNVHRHFLMPWAQKVAADSGNRLRIQIFPAMQLGGAPPQLYDQARDGVVDIVWTLPGSTPGRFPKTEAIELPFVPHRTAAVNSRVITELFPRHLREEYRETQILAIFAHDRGLVHSSKEVRTQEDLRGLKLRFPTRLAGEALRALGAAPIGMPVPQVPEALSQRAIDGAVVPWEVVPSIRLQELVRHHTDIPGSPTLYTTSFVLAMNPAKYNGLPPELKAVLDANSGLPAAEMAAKVWDEQGPVVEEMVRRRSQNAIISLTPEEAARWRATTEPVVTAWVAQTRERGFDGAALLEETRTLVARFGAGA